MASEEKKMDAIEHRGSCERNVADPFFLFAYKSKGWRRWEEVTMIQVNLKWSAWVHGIFNKS